MKTKHKKMEGAARDLVAGPDKVRTTLVAQNTMQNRRIERNRHLSSVLAVRGPTP